MNPTLDLSDLPVVDAHCHSYFETPKVLSAEDLARHASLAVQPDFLNGKFSPSEGQIRSSRNRLLTMYNEQPFLMHMIRLLSSYFQCNPDLQIVAKTRSARAQDFDDYVRELFRNAEIRGLVVDGGYPALSEDDMIRFPAKAVRVFRLETFIKELLNQHNSFHEFCSAYELGIREAILQRGYIGLKSIIAYRTGLKIQRVESDEARRDFLAAKDSHAELAWFGPKVKKLRDFLFVYALELSVDLNVPMQVHTGVGDYDIVLDQCDPSSMYELLKDEKFRYATVILIHSGFPHNQNAAYMASVLPNVFLDFSLTIPFLNPVGHERLMEVLQIAPSSKIMYGSDGFNLPELIWMGAKVGKKTLGKCLGALVQGGLFDENEANRIARRILFENANELYRLGLS